MTWTGSTEIRGRAATEGFGFANKTQNQKTFQGLPNSKTFQDEADGRPSHLLNVTVRGGAGAIQQGGGDEKAGGGVCKLLRVQFFIYFL